MLELQNRPFDGTVNAGTLVEGQVAVIVSWNNEDHIGKIVQRFRDSLIHLGGQPGSSFTTFFESRTPDTYRVRILKPGETLVVGE